MIKKKPYFLKVRLVAQIVSPAQTHAYSIINKNCKTNNRISAIFCGGCSLLL